jgi:hypothetical protein
MDVSPGEKIARYIFYRRQFSVMNRVVKFGAFIPPSNSDQISVYRISSLADREVWSIGRDYVETEERRIKARADFLAQHVYENSLNVIPDTQPHELHANITPFPANKSERQSIARKLALVSQLVLMPTA